MLKNNFKIGSVVLMLPPEKYIDTIYNYKIGKIIDIYRIFDKRDIEYKWIVSFNYKNKENTIAFSEKRLLKLSEK